MIELCAPLGQICRVAMDEQNGDGVSPPSVVNVQAALGPVHERRAHVCTKSEEQDRRQDVTPHNVPTSSSMRRARSSRVATNAS
jgi:hypothetical protein